MFFLLGASQRATGSVKILARDKTRRDCRRSGFTLLELLVCVAIIAVLIALLVPALSAARERSRATMCAANLHGYGQIMNMYVAEFGGLLPNSTIAFSGYVSTEVSNTSGTTTAFYFCPSTIIGAPYITGINPFGQTIGLTYGMWFPGAGKQYAQLTHPSTTAFMGDTASWISAGVKGLSNAGLGPPNSLLGDPILMDFHGRHSNRGNVLWYDYHVSPEVPYTVTPDPTQYGMDTQFHVGFLTPVQTGVPLSTFEALPEPVQDQYFNP